MKQATELLTARQLAQRFRVSPDTVRAWARRGLIPTIRISRKAMRFNFETVLRALAADQVMGEKSRD